MNTRLKAVRNTLKKTQSEFGSMCGKSRDAIANYETGRVVPDDAFIKLLSVKFNVNEQWLLTGEGEMFTETKVSLLDKLAEKYNLDKYDMSIIRHYMELDPEDRKKFVSLMKVIFASSPVETKKQEANNNVCQMNEFTPKPDNNLSPSEKRAIVNGEIDQEEKEIIL